ncbi:MAG TPA: tyrosine-type recombinase/integrase [Anaerolineales bacterium]|nr:tyrosine-type recombinase/integrase [Anaerolineales bacterium]
MEEQVSAFLANPEFTLTYSSSTRLAYQNDLYRFMRFLERKEVRTPVVADFTAESVAEFLAEEKAAGRKPSTILRRRASLRRFAAYLHEQCPEWAPQFNARQQIIDDIIETATPVTEARYLTKEQVQALWTVMEPNQHPRAWRDRAILALLLESALSVGNLLALDLPDLDAQNFCLRIPDAEGQDYWLTLKEAAKALAKYLTDGRPELNYQPDEPALFISQNGGRMSRQGVWQVLRHWGKKAGLPFTLSPRLVRHTAVVLLMDDALDITTIQTLLGHSNPLSTHALLRRLRESVNQHKN